MCTNSHAVEVLIKDVFGQGFKRFGYQLSIEELNDMGFSINHKKTYRLMGKHGLLHEKKNKSGLPSQWVYIPVENWFFITFGENT